MTYANGDVFTGEFKCDETTVDLDNPRHGNIRRVALYTIPFTFCIA